MVVRFEDEFLIVVVCYFDHYPAAQTRYEQSQIPVLFATAGMYPLVRHMQTSASSGIRRT